MLSLRLFALLFVLFCTIRCAPEMRGLTVTSASEQNQSESDIESTPVNNDEDTSEEISKLEFIPMNWDEHSNDALKWSEFTYKAVEELGRDLLDSTPRDISSFCPNYSELNLEGKKMFWIYLLSTMVRYESFFNPATTYTEAFNDVNNIPIVSRGLLQLSIESSLGYGCKLNSAKDLHDPEQNLRCGIRILNLWVKRDGVISDRVNSRWHGGARYWAVLRTHKDFLNKIKSYTKKAEVCL